MVFGHSYVKVPNSMEQTMNAACSTGDQMVQDNIEVVTPTKNGGNISIDLKLGRSGESSSTLKTSVSISRSHKPQ